MKFNFMVAHKDPHCSLPNETWYLTPMWEWDSSVVKAGRFSISVANHWVDEYQKENPYWVVWAEEFPEVTVSNPYDDYDRAMGIL